VAGLRRLVVLEHELVPVRHRNEDDALASDIDSWLSDAEAEALLALNENRKGFCQRVWGGVKFAQFCGVVRLPHVVVEILPKVGLGDVREAGEEAQARAKLLAMLRTARRLPVTRVADTPQSSVRAPLLDAFIAAFLDCALDQAHRGLLTRYVSHAEDLPLIKGRFHAAGHIRRNLGRPHLLHCEHDEFTVDNSYNRAVVAALEACRHWMQGADTQRLWFEVQARWTGVALTKMTAKQVARLPRDRTTHRYEALLTWCEWLLSLTSPSMGRGISDAPGLLFDMNKLFEAHVAAVVASTVEPGDRMETQGPERALGQCNGLGVFTLKPDITVWREEGLAGQRIRRIIDAKWKRLDPSSQDFGVRESDVYQLLAYAIAYGCDTVELFYPRPAMTACSSPPSITYVVMNGVSQAVNVRIELVAMGFVS
jgi:5-methylcytosine-specific restriction enzyme subunit McrC